MSYFKSPALSQGQSWTESLDETWNDTTIDFTWSNPSDSTLAAEYYGSADEGGTWFVVLGLSYPSGATGPVYVTNKPINAIKVEVTTAVSGNTLTSRVTGK